jgi:hypothetical protein
VATASTVRHWSVTTLIKEGLGTPEALVVHGKREIAGVCFNRYEMLGAFKRDNDRRGAKNWAIDKYWEDLNRAAARGRDLHTVAEKWALGVEPKVAPEIRPYADQYLRFLEQYRPKFLMAEAPVYNPTFGYAGTCDGVVELAGSTVLFDIKTTAWGPNDVDPDTGNRKSRPPYTEVALQCVAYRRAEIVGLMSEERFTDKSQRYYVYDPEAHHEPMPETEGAVCVVVSPEDFLVVPIDTSERVWRAFRVAMEAARWRVETSKAVIGVPMEPPVEVLA